MTERPSPNSVVDSVRKAEALAGFVRLPGFVRRWEIHQVLQPGIEFVVEPAGHLDGVELYSVHHRDPGRRRDDEVGIPVNVTLDGEPRPLAARMLPIHQGEALTAILVLDEGPGETATLAQIREHLVTTWSKSAASSAAAMAETRAPVGAR